MVFLVAATIQIILVVGLAFWLPAKAAEMAVPIAIIVGGLAGPYLSRTWWVTALLGAVLGLLNTGVLIFLSHAFSLPDKLTLPVRIAASFVFAGGTSLGTWLWANYGYRKP